LDDLVGRGQQRFLDDLVGDLLGAGGLRFEFAT